MRTAAPGGDAAHSIARYVQPNFYKCLTCGGSVDFMRAKVSSWSVVLFSSLMIVLLTTGCGGGGSSSTASNVTATPTFSPGGGTYTSSKAVTISDATSGAVLYCTTDGSTPTPSSPQCSQPTTVYQTEFLQAMAVAPGKAASAVVSAGYVINLNTAPAPTFNPTGGTYSSAQQVTISDSLSGANLYYTLDGSMPSAQSTLYTGPVAISQSSTLSAIAVATGYTSSAVATAAYTIQAASAVPTVSSLSPASAAVGGAAFTLTVNGTNFDSGSTVKWGSTALATTYVSATQLTAAVPANLLATAGSVVISVTTSAGASAYAAFAVNVALPAITSLSPSSAAAGGAAFKLTVTGTNFDSSAKINWNGSALTTTYVSATSLTASVSASLIAKAGSATVTVSSAAGTSNNLTFNIGSGASVPAVTALSPQSGAAGTSVTVTGTNFTGATAVNFGATPATSFTVNSASSITAVSPAGTGTVDVTVVTSNGTSATVAADQFTYVSSSAPTLTGISPASGSPSGGTSVAVTGTNFTGATAVNFGATPAASFTVNSATSITAVSPAGTGTVDVTVVTPNGTSATVAADQFTYGGAAINGVVVGGTGASAVGLTASVQLYAAGTTAYGPVAAPGATKIGSAVQTDPTTGAFTVAYSCSTAQAPGDQLYLVATGSNNQVVLMTALGSCSGLQAGASYTINEATTVASVYALQQFMAADGSIGAAISAATSQSYTGLSNAFKTVNNLVDSSSGTVRDHTPDYPTNFAGDPNIVNNSTVPQARINTLANALNACVSNSSGCGGLFAAATTGSAPTNTLQAILNIAQNPGNNVSNVYAAASSTAYAPSLPGAPNDWTLALTFTGGGFGVAPSISGTDSAGNSGVGPIISTSLAIDANGNVFVAGFGEYGYPSFSVFSGLDLPILAEFNNLGAPQTPPTRLSSDATPLITFGGNNVGQAIAGGFGLSSVAIYTNGNIWAGDLNVGGNVYTLSPGLSVLASAAPGSGVNNVAIDNNNNAWAGGDTIFEYTYVAGNTTLQAPTLEGASSAYSARTISNSVFDSSFNLWSYDSGSSTIFQITTDGSLIYSAFPTRGTGSTQAMSLAADGMGNIYACGDVGGTTLDVFTAIPTPGIANTYPVGSRGCGEQLLLDGLGHLFAINNGFGRAGHVGSTIDEYTTTGGAISPANGYTGTSSAEQPTITIDSNAPATDTLGYTPTTGAIDGSGNLWLVNADTSNSGGSGNPTGNVLVEFVGIAAPVVTPISAAVTNAQLGVRP
jgi:Chitobiase/beta-hexosaminidase C-terminal domain/IPT/TIG domain